MAPRTRKSQRLLRNQALEGSNESHASLDHSMHTNTTNEVRVVGQNTNVQHIGNPTPPQGDLIGKGKRTFASLNDSPGIPATVQPTPTSATKKVRNAEPALHPTYWDQDPYPTTEEDSTDDDNLAALAQGDPSKLQKVMASEIPSWLDPALGARRCPSVSNTVGTGTSNMSLGNNIYTMPPPVLAETTLPTQPRQDRAQAATGTESTSAWPANTNLLFAPGVTRVLLARQRQLIRDIVRLAVDDLRATLIFNDTFPDGILATCFIRSSLNTAAEKVVKKKPAASSIQERLLADDDYVLKIAPVLCARIPLFRSEVKDRCNSIVLAEYTSKVPADIIRSVDWQLSGYNYVHPKGPKGLGSNRLIMRSQPYRNSRIILVIHDLFFTGGNGSFRARYDHLFPGNTGNDGQVVREVPIPMVALVATALYASLREWRTGDLQTTEFSTTTYFDVYRNHISTLEVILNDRESAFHKMMAAIYAQASVVGNGAAGTPMAQLDLDILE
ncbi:hypothetical protein EDB92DRAFT_1823134 [Lactarius akahatsu]|uniref:DUF6532 domain-containing protein n=1 Tax=Lactarius akahatsu TaxID=416441 RepID=A0AAD4Q206_9AGAM|nr:hypothetical protein EDB92DRAFT_1823134 [Lactarius akahatsu]